MMLLNRFNVFPILNEKHARPTRQGKARLKILHDSGYLVEKSDQGEFAVVREVAADLLRPQ